MVPMMDALAVSWWYDAKENGRIILLISERDGIEYVEQLERQIWK